MRSFFTKYSGDQARIMRWPGHVAGMWEGRGAYSVLVGNLRERDHWKDSDVDGRIILKWIFKKWEREIDGIDLTQNSDRWRTLVNAVMNLRVP